jgi:two-component system, sensor histidine kinase LadS
MRMLWLFFALHFERTVSARLLSCLSSLLLLVFTAVPAQAQTALALDRLQGELQSVSTGGQTFELLALQGLKAASTPQEALLSSGYEPFRAKDIYELDGGKALWLKLRIKLDQPLQQNWVLSSPKTFLDDLKLYTRDAQGQWQMQQAGDNIAHAHWTIRSLAPQFKLPLFPSGEHDVLIKVVQNFPQQIPLMLQDEQTARSNAQTDFLIAGIAVGLLGLILLLSLHLAINYRDPAYAWYAFYVLLSILSLGAYLGLASYLLWPNAEHWPEYSVLVLILASVVAQLWFCQEMFLRESQSPWMKKAAMAIAGIGALLVVLMLFTPGPIARIVLFSIGMVMSFATVLLIVGMAARKKAQSAYLWLLAYSPLLISVVLALMDNLSFIDPLGMPYALPAYTLACEAVILLFALHLHAKNRHALQERERVMASIDPLTGFLGARVFQDRLNAQWCKLAGSSQDMSLALIYINHRSEQNDSESALRLEQKLLRSVRLLRTITRDVDLIGRIGGNVLAVAMPDIPMGDDLNNRLARLIALGMMTDRYDTQPIELRFRIAVGTRGTWGDDLRALDNNLRGTIMQSGGWSSKPIRYITPLSAPAPLPTATAKDRKHPKSASSNGANDQPALNGVLSSSDAMQSHPSNRNSGGKSL